MTKPIDATPAKDAVLVKSPGTATAIMTGDGRYVVMSPALAERIARQILGIHTNSGVMPGPSWIGK